MDKDTTGTMSRRSLLKRGAGAATVGAVGAAATGTTAAQSDLYNGYLSDVGNFEGETSDATGMDEVTVSVGAGTSGLLFDPAAIVIDPGTTVNFEWTGNGGAHNVYNDADTSMVDEPLFNSGEAENTSGVEYSFTFENADTGLHPYACQPHRSLGMKGVIAVGSDNVQGDTVPFGEVEETLNAVSVFGGAAVFGVTSLLGISAYRELFSEEELDH